MILVAVEVNKAVGVAAVPLLLNNMIWHAKATCQIVFIQNSDNEGPTHERKHERKSKFSLNQEQL